MSTGTKFNTFNITSSNSPYRIVAGMNVLTCTFKMSNATGDAGTFQGALVLNNANNAAQPSEAIAIGAGEAGILQSPGASQSLDGITFNVTQGTLRLILAQ